VEPFDPSTNSGLRVFDREHGAKSKIRGQRTARASNQSTVISESTGFASDYAMPRRSEIRGQITEDRITEERGQQENAKFPMSNEKRQE
jgi:hypothetical protein